MELDLGEANFLSGGEEKDAFFVEFHGPFFSGDRLELVPLVAVILVGEVEGGVLVDLFLVLGDFFFDLLMAPPEVAEADKVEKEEET